MWAEHFIEAELPSYPMIPWLLFSLQRMLPSEVAASVGCESFFKLLKCSRVELEFTCVHRTYLLEVRKIS